MRYKEKELEFRKELQTKIKEFEEKLEKEYGGHIVNDQMRGYFYQGLEKAKQHFKEIFGKSEGK